MRSVPVSLARASSCSGCSGCRERAAATTTASSAPDADWIQSDAVPAASPCAAAGSDADAAASRLWPRRRRRLRLLHARAVPMHRLHAVARSRRWCRSLSRHVLSAVQDRPQAHPSADASAAPSGRKPATAVATNHAATDAAATAADAIPITHADADADADATSDDDAAADDAHAVSSSGVAAGSSCSSSSSSVRGSSRLPSQRRSHVTFRAPGVPAAPTRAASLAAAAAPSCHAATASPAGSSRQQQSGTRARAETRGTPVAATATTHHPAAPAAKAGFILSSRAWPFADPAGALRWLQLHRQPVLFVRALRPPRLHRRLFGHGQRAARSSRCAVRGGASWRPAACAVSSSHGVALQLQRHRHGALGCTVELRPCLLYSDAASRCCGRCELSSPAACACLWTAAASGGVQRGERSGRSSRRRVRSTTRRAPCGRRRNCIGTSRHETRQSQHQEGGIQGESDAAPCDVAAIDEMHHTHSTSFQLNRPHFMTILMRAARMYTYSYGEEVQSSRARASGESVMHKRRASPLIPARSASSRKSGVKKDVVCLN